MTAVMTATQEAIQEICSAEIAVAVTKRERVFNMSNLFDNNNCCCDPCCNNNNGTDSWVIILIIIAIFLIFCWGNN